MKEYKPNIKPIEYTDKSYLIAENIVPMNKPDVLAETAPIPDIGGAPDPEGDVTYNPSSSHWELWVLLALVAGIAVFFGGGR